MRTLTTAAAALISFFIGFIVAASASEHASYPDGCHGPCVILAGDVFVDAVLGGLTTAIVVLTSVWLIFRLTRS